MSPLLCREVCFRAFGDASPRLERLDDAQRARLEHELDALVFSVETNNLAPTMLFDGDRPKERGDYVWHHRKPTSNNLWTTCAADC